VKTVKDYIDKYGSNGVVTTDAGNGSSGPGWIDAGDLTPEQLAEPVTDLQPYGEDREDDQCWEALSDICGGLGPDCNAAATAWLYPIGREESNPYRIRIIV
jgi:hypothetical protein